MTRVERWERRPETPLLFLAVAFLVAYAWPVIDPRLAPGLTTVLTALSWTVWVAFAVDFAIRRALAEQRGSYAVRHWYDVALIVLPMLRPLRLLRPWPSPVCSTGPQPVPSSAVCRPTSPGLRS